MNENLRDALDSMYDARIPNQWLKARINSFYSKLYLELKQFWHTHNIRLTR